MNTISHILVLDDDDSVRLAIVAVLTRDEWKVESAGSAEEALDLCEKTTFDMMVVDKNLPGMSGVDFMREVRRQKSDAACIMITGYASASSAIEMVHLGLDSYVEKPFDDIFEITRKVEQSLEKLKERRAAFAEPVSSANEADMETEDTFKKASSHFKKSGEMMVSSHPPIDQVCRILVACPGAYERNWLSRQLNEWGEIECVESSKELLHRLQEEAPNVLVLDFELKDPGVFELLPEIRSLAPRTGCLIAIEKPAFTTLTRLIDLEINGVIEKPFDIGALKTEVSRLVKMSFFPQSPFE